MEDSGCNKMMRASARVPAIAYWTDRCEEEPGYFKRCLMRNPIWRPIDLRRILFVLGSAVDFDRTWMGRYDEGHSVERSELWRTQKVQRRLRLTLLINSGVMLHVPPPRGGRFISIFGSFITF